MRDTLPKFMFYQIWRACNLRCTHCDFWKLKELPGALTDDQMCALVRDFATLNPNGVLVTCSGEPTLAGARFWALCKQVRESGLRQYSVMNGTTIKTLDAAKRMVADGPHEITISLDGPDAALHDKFRGVKGSFDMATRALRLLVQAREQLGATDTRIYAMTILCRSLAGRLDEFFNLVLRDIGADKLKLGPIMPSFRGSGNDPRSAVDAYFDSEHLKNIDAILSEIQGCDAKYGIKRNPEWLKQVRGYGKDTTENQRNGLMSIVMGANKTAEHICNSYDRNIMVGQDGDMRLCFSLHFPGRKWEQAGDLSKFWHDESPAWLDQMRGCNRFCGISHSHRSASATLRQA